MSDLNFVWEGGAFFEMFVKGSVKGSIQSGLVDDGRVIASGIDGLGWSESVVCGFVLVNNSTLCEKSCFRTLVVWRSCCRGSQVPSRR